MSDGGGIMDIEVAYIKKAEHRVQHRWLMMLLARSTGVVCPVYESPLTNLI